MEGESWGYAIIMTLIGLAVGVLTHLALTYGRPPIDARNVVITGGVTAIAVFVSYVLGYVDGRK